MAFARLRFVVFIIIVLGLPAGLMAATDPQLVDLGKLAMILSPAVAGLALSTKRWSRGSATSWGWISGAAAITLLVTLGALSVAIAVGAASFRLEDTPLDAVMRSAGGSALTSVLKNWGGLAVVSPWRSRRLEDVGACWSWDWSGPHGTLFQWC